MCVESRQEHQILNLLSYMEKEYRLIKENKRNGKKKD